MPLELTRQLGGMLLVRGDLEHYHRLLDLRYTAIRDFGDPLRLWGNHLANIYAHRQIERGGTPIKFAALSPRYRAWKAVHYPGRPILVRTARMKYGYTSRATKTRLTVDNKQPYWIYHQTGTSRMPARKVFQVGEEEFNLLRGLMRDHVLRMHGVTP